MSQALRQLSDASTAALAHSHYPAARGGKKSIDIDIDIDKELRGARALTASCVRHRQRDG